MPLKTLLWIQGHKLQAYCDNDKLAQPIALKYTVTFGSMLWLVTITPIKEKSGATKSSVSANDLADPPFWR